MDQNVQTMVNRVVLDDQFSQAAGNVASRGAQLAGAMQSSASAASAMGSATVDAMAIAAASLENIDKQLAGLVAGERAATVSAEGLSTAHEHLGGAVGGANAALQQLENHSGTLARGMNALGEGAGAAAARVQGLVGAIVEMEAAAPELLAISAALAALFAGFELLKSGIQDATEAQTQMSGLRTVLDEQGAAWDTTSASIQHFLDVESMASGATRGELITALRELVDANHDTAASETELRTIEEIHVATGKSIAEITHIMVTAETARGIGLAQLDAHLKPLIASHASMDQIMQVLHKDYGHSLDDLDSNALAWDRAKSSMAAAAERIGTDLLPALLWLAKAVLAGVMALEDLWNSLKQIGKGFVEMSEPIHGAILAFEAFYDAVHGNMGKAKAEWAQGSREMANTVQEVGHGMADVLVGSLTALGNAGTLGLIGIAAHWKDASHEVNAAINEHDRAQEHMAHVPGNVGNERQPREKVPTPFDTSAAQPAAENVEKLTTADNDLTAALKAGEAATAAINKQIDLNATSASVAAEHMLELKTAHDRAAASAEALTLKVEGEVAGESRAELAVRASYRSYDTAVESLNKYKASLGEAGAKTEEQKKALQAHEDAVKRTKQAYDEAEKSLSGWTTTLTKQQHQLEADTKAMNAFTDAQTKLWAQTNDTVNDANRAQAEALATYGKGPAALAAYWHDAFEKAKADLNGFYSANGYITDALVKQYDDTYRKMTESGTKYWETEQDDIKKAREAYDKWADTAVNDIAKLVDSGGKGFKSLADDFKQMLKDMEEALLKSILFKLFFPNTPQGSQSWQQIASNTLASPFGGIAPAAGQTGPGGVPITSLAAGAIPGATAASGAGALGAAYSAIGTIPGSAASNPVYTIPTDAGANYLMATTGSPGGIPAIVASTPSDWGGGVLPVSNVPGVGGNAPATINAGGALARQRSLGGVAGGALMGYGIGSSIAPGNPWAAGLGALGGAAGEYFGGPVGEMVGSFVGGTVGSLLGPHWGPASNYPDRGPGAQSYQDWLKAYNGGAGDTGFKIEDWMKAVDPSKLTGDQLAIYNTFKSLGGSSGDIGISNEHDGTFTLGSGQKVSVTDLQADVAKWQNSQANGLPPAGTWTISRSYPDYNSSTLTPGNPYQAAQAAGSGWGTNGAGGRTTQPVGQQPEPTSGAAPTRGLPGAIGGGGGTVPIYVDADALAQILTARQRARGTGLAFNGYNPQNRSTLV